MAAPVRAPELEGRGGWIGVDRPLSLGRLRGKAVLVHFWASSCVPCLRMLDRLRPLEDLLAEELLVVGVHSPRFPREADHGVVVQAVARLGVAHPVLDDSDHRAWDAYGVRGWPTAVLVDPAGYVAGVVEGEVDTADLERGVREVVDRHVKAGGRLRRRLVAVRRPVPPAGPLAFPAKVACSPDGRYLVVADTGHDRVLVCSATGVVLEAHTGFLQPRGVRFDPAGGVLVCDTGADRLVRTDGEVLSDALHAPWDLVGDGRGAWVVAEAGGHRLVRVRPGELRARVVAGSGAEGLDDGPATKAQLAAPTGVARTAEGFAFVDGEASALRLVVEDRSGGAVSTLVGESLSGCGDADGPRRVARLQHPQGVAADPAGGPVHVADAFNSKLRVWEDGVLRTLPVTGLDQPGGLDLLPDGRLVVADTGNSRIVVVDPATGAVEPVELDETWVHGSDGPAVRVRRGATATVEVGIDLVDEALDRSGASGPPVEVVVAARPAALLDGGGRTWQLHEPFGTVQVAAGHAGAGLLLVEIRARTTRSGAPGTAVRVHRRRHALDVT